MSGREYIDEGFVDISDIDWQNLMPEAKKAFWRERKMEYLASSHDKIATFLKSRGLEFQQYWTKGWAGEKEMVIKNAELMLYRQTEARISDVMQHAFSVEQYAAHVLTTKLQLEGKNMKVKDLIDIIHVMRLIQGKPNSIAPATPSHDDDIDGEVMSMDD